MQCYLVWKEVFLGYEECVIQLHALVLFVLHSTLLSLEITNAVPCTIHQSDKIGELANAGWAENYALYTNKSPIFQQWQLLSFLDKLKKSCIGGGIVLSELVVHWLDPNMQARTKPLAAGKNDAHFGATAKLCNQSHWWLWNQQCIASMATSLMPNSSVGKLECSCWGRPSELRLSCCNLFPSQTWWGWNLYSLWRKKCKKNLTGIDIGANGLCEIVWRKRESKHWKGRTNW